MSSPLDRKAVVSEFVFVQEVDGEAVLLDAAGQQYFGLNEVGVRIWTLLVEGRSLEQVHAALVGEYDVDPDVLEGDLLVLVEALAAENLITLREGEDGSPPPGS